MPERSVLWRVWESLEREGIGKGWWLGGPAYGQFAKGIDVKAKTYSFFPEAPAFLSIPGD